MRYGGVCFVLLLTNCQVLLALVIQLSGYKNECVTCNIDLPDTTISLCYDPCAKTRQLNRLESKIYGCHFSSHIKNNAYCISKEIHCWQNNTHHPILDPNEKTECKAMNLTYTDREKNIEISYNGPHGYKFRCTDPNYTPGKTSWNATVNGYHITYEGPACIDTTRMAPNTTTENQPAYKSPPPLIVLLAGGIGVGLFLLISLGLFIHWERGALNSLQSARSRALPEIPVEEESDTPV